jgi:hypothetical protein
MKRLLTSLDESALRKGVRTVVRDALALAESELSLLVDELMPDVLREVDVLRELEESA